MNSVTFVALRAFVLVPPVDAGVTADRRTPDARSPNLKKRSWRLLAGIALTVFATGCSHAPTPAEIAKAGQEKLANAHSLSMTVQEHGNPASTMSLLYAKPGKYLLELPDVWVASDAKNTWMYQPRPKQYVHNLVDSGQNHLPMLFPGFEAFSSEQSPFKRGTPKLGKLDGVPAVDVPYSAGSENVDVYLDPVTKLPEAMVNGQTRLDFKPVTVDPKVTDSLFVFDPPKGSEEVAQLASDPDAGRLLKVGSDAPAFRVATPNGAPISLGEALRGHRALLINFWFVDCPACHDEFPKLQNLYSTLKTKGLGLVSIDNGDQPAAIEKFAKESMISFPIGINGQGAHDLLGPYGVVAFPTNYLIGPDGKIVVSQVGYDEDELRAGLRKLGIKA
jgi:outer membrane lipoprotein-sorting protein/peroxiredoxin